MAYPSILLGTFPSLVEHDEIQKGTKMYCFQKNLKYFKQHVHQWNKEVFENIFQERKLLEQNRGPIGEIHSLRLHNHSAVGGE